MTAALVHRGPDDDGFYEGPHVGLGMRRLRILDLDGGKQPFFNETGEVVTVFNGELYNFRDVAAGLTERGHQLRTRCDTEIIPHLYEERGRDLAEALVGMFAVAVWDRSREQLLLIRDRIGIKPLFYAPLPGGLAFASEIKALLTLPDVDRSLDWQAIDEYLSFNYIPGERTAYRGVRKLLPGHALTWRHGQFRVDRYWAMPAPGSAKPSPSLPEAEERTRFLLDQAVRRRLISDVPLGLFLSGGLDSTAILAFMAEASSSPVRTFSVSFQEQSYDEAPFAQLAASAFGAHHEQVRVEADAAQLLPSLLAAFDEPFGDSSSLAVWHVCELARRHVTVALGGDGGDEVFAGYETYRAQRLTSYLDRLPRWPLRALGGLVNRLPVSDAKVSFEYKAKKFLSGMHQPGLHRALAWKAIFDDHLKQRLYRPGAGPAESPFAAWARRFGATPAGLAQLIQFDLNVYLADDILVKLDRMSMAHSLEARVPLLDHELVEYAVSLPLNFKLRGWTQKYLLKRILRGRVPAAILQRRKAGFNLPLGPWFRGSLREVARAALDPLPAELAERIAQPAVNRLLQEHAERHRDWGRQIWTLLILVGWYRQQQAPIAAAAPARQPVTVFPR